ncbi:MAG: lipid II:glycine glycyltransferase (peptidoglycan interpeptide bridge formation enzyme) [Polaribacter sp.]|jgi:lipid II:glycine glycyltransferase (peptidoglycan interpeptide bridge formation enzyme)
MIKIVKTKKEWDSFLKKVDDFDFYHTYDYHKLSIKDDEECILITYTVNNTVLGLPFIVRQIPNSNYKDITSVYGYAGPISKNFDHNFDHLKFSEDFDTCLKSQNIVSVFSRLNPFINLQHQVLKGIGTIKHVGQVVNIDLLKSLDIQRQNYQRRIKTQINKARRLSKVIKASSKEEILEFIEIYYENMDRVQARSSYYFKPDYFFKFLESESLLTELYLIRLIESNEIIAGAMFIKTNNVVQYHLSGCKEAYLDIAPIKLLIDEMRIRGTQEGYSSFNLGGGYGAHNDSLLRFKLSFSKELVDFHVWSHVINQKVYDNLTKETATKDPDFFPSYRNPN